MFLVDFFRFLICGVQTSAIQRHSPLRLHKDFLLNLYDGFVGGCRYDSGMKNSMNFLADEAEEVLLDKEISMCSGGSAVEMIGATQHIIARMQSLQLQAIHYLSVVRGKSGHAADEVALELAVSRQSGQMQVAFAEALCTRLPKVLSALHNGDIDAGKARKVFEVISPLSDELTRQVDDAIAGKLAGKTLQVFVVLLVKLL